jgi:hypothetical protein
MKKTFFAVLFLSLILSVPVVQAAQKTAQKKNTVVQKSVTQTAAPAASKDPEESMGLGFNSQLGGLTSISLRIWTNDQLAIEPLFGFSLGGDFTGVDLGAKVLGVIKKESNLKCYWWGLLGFENTGIKNGPSETGTTFAGGVGVEVFLDKLPNLGIGTEIGVGYNSIAKSFSTMSGLLPSVGMHYYFR